jgi:hypothetical protein
MRIVVAGASGFLGGLLTGRLRATGHQVVRLVRRPAAAPDEVSWQPATGTLDPAALAGADAVANLAGTGLGTRVGRLQVPVRPWTAAYAREFRSSRVDTTATLARAVAAADPPPRVFLVGSGTGWYGDTGETELDEAAPAGAGSFAELAREWEAAGEPAGVAGARVVRLRTGLPLHRGGGYLGPVLLPFRLGLGGKVGTGRQWQPWIAMADWLAAVEFVLARDDLAGPVNLVGPAPVRNTELVRTLGELLHRPTVLPVPAPALRLLLGELGREVVRSQRVVPGVLRRAGFEFRHTDVRSALRAALADRPG